MNTLTRSSEMPRFVMLLAATLLAPPLTAQMGSVEPQRGAGSATLDRNPAAAVTSERIARAPVAEPGNWLTYHGS